MKNTLQRKIESMTTEEIKETINRIERSSLTGKKEYMVYPYEEELKKRLETE